MDKTSLRKLVREKKKSYSLQEKIALSVPIMHRVELLDDFVAAKTVLLYWSMDDEVHTHDFVNRWYDKKCLLLPCVDGNDLLLRRFTGPESMCPGPQFGIPEPVGEVFEDLHSVDVIVVPGVAFDRNRNRMGRGRGFYDRLLKSTPNAKKIGVAFDFQMFDNIPVEPFDVPMDIVVTGSSCV